MSMDATNDAPPLRLALPKGRMQAAVVALLADAGIALAGGERDYRPRLSLPGFAVKLLKPQNIVEMLQQGSRDLGFAGADWVEELGGGLVELLDTRLDPVRLVAAAPSCLLRDGRLPLRPLVVASEYERLARRWAAERGIEARLLRSFGATEVFPPEDADVIVDNTASGATLRENDLVVVDEILASTTRLYASPSALGDAGRCERIEALCLLLRSVLEARGRVMVEVNVTGDRLEAVVAILPCMREPTIAALHHGAGFAVKAAVPKALLPQVIPRVRAAGGTDIVVARLEQIIP